MGLYSKLFGENKNQENNTSVFYTQQDELMKQASQNAQDNFKHFWRELYWEFRRIVQVHDLAMVKIPFKQTLDGQSEPIIEHMWVNDIDFDGETIIGKLANNPNQLTNIKNGDVVMRKVEEISDWMISILGKTYGGFTIQVMRSGMSDEERQNHDKAWGLDFGDYNEVLLVYEQKEKPENLIEHPMCINIADKMRKFLKENPEQLTATDNNGNTFLHKEAIAGNKACIEVLLEFGVDKTIKSSAGKTALDYAKYMNWENIIEILN